MTVTNTPIHLTGLAGEPLGVLSLSALDVIAEAEAIARSRNLSKRTALPTFLKEYLESEGYEIGVTELNRVINEFNRVRHGESLISIQIACSLRQVTSRSDQAGSSNQSLGQPKAIKSFVQNSQPMQRFFEAERVYPDVNAKALYDRLVGLDDYKNRLLIELEMLLHPQKLETWSREHHQGKVLRLCEQLRDRVPLILLEGDVGTGKTALAETIGDALARKNGGKTKVHLLKINSQIRGTGLVGEMSDLIVQAFIQAEARAASLKDEPVLLLLDEADALAARRDTQQMHHEDKAGLNTLLQRLDNLRLQQLAIAVIFITNRPDALDPAIRRRAALDLCFERPNDAVRAEIIRHSVPELNWTSEQLDRLVHLTGAQESKNEGVEFTASDLTNRLLMGALREAFSQNRELTVADLVDQANQLSPSPRMGTI
jgi:SpoVK/Ycf46/Vps4 family AAA+-type ATPase